jgi:CO dehydrogenase maturation factor
VCSSDLKVRSLAADLGVKKVSVAANKVRGEDDERFLKDRLPEEDLLGFIRYREEVIAADRQGLSPFDTSADTREEIRRIKACIDRDGRKQ